LPGLGTSTVDEVSAYRHSHRQQQNHGRMETWHWSTSFFKAEMSHGLLTACLFPVYPLGSWERKRTRPVGMRIAGEHALRAYLCIAYQRP
jgi:hypothetical protein